MNDIEFVFPAHAGMSPMFCKARGLANSFPRTRGDEPLAVQLVIPTMQFSPHTRG